MDKQVFIIVLCLALCISTDAKLVSPFQTPRPVSDKYVDFDVYKIESRPYPDGVLSVNVGVTNKTYIPTVGLSGDGAGQKWRLGTEMFYYGFQLRPTSHESFVLEQDEANTFLTWAISFTILGQHKFWYLDDAGNGYTRIQNTVYETCLTATGMNQPVISARCNNSEDQQWNFIKL